MTDTDSLTLGEYLSIIIMPLKSSLSQNGCRKCRIKTS